MSLYREIVKAAAPLVLGYHRVKYYGEENVPPPGQAAIISPNHSSWFGWDGMIVNSILKDRKIRWVGWSYEEKYPLWDKLVDVFEPIWVSKTKPFPYEMVVNEILGQGGQVGLFPEGNTNPMGKWYRLREFHTGCVKLSRMTGAPIVPVSVAGLEAASPVLWQDEPKNSPAMNAIPLPLLLPTRVTVRFGEPVYPDQDSDNPMDEDSMKEAAEDLRRRVLELLREDRPKARIAE